MLVRYRTEFMQRSNAAAGTVRAGIPQLDTPKTAT
jgi:hypothetical protein